MDKKAVNIIFNYFNKVLNPALNILLLRNKCDL